MPYAITDLKSTRDCTIREIRYKHIRYCTCDLKWFFSYECGTYVVMALGEDDVLHPASGPFRSLSAALRHVNLLPQDGPQR